MALEKVMEEGAERSEDNGNGSKSMESVIKIPTYFKIDGYFSLPGGFYWPNGYWLKSNEGKRVPHSPNITSKENKTRKTGVETIYVVMNNKSGSSENKKMGVIFGIMIMALCFHMYTTPLIVKAYLDYNDLNSEFGIDFSLKKTSFLPANLFYGLDDAFVLSSGKSYGVVFSHNNLEFELGESLKVSVCFQRLFPLLRNDYKNYSMISLVTGTVFSTISTVILGITLYIVCIAVTYWKNKIQKKKTCPHDKTSVLTKYKHSRLILLILFIVLIYHLIVSPAIIYMYTFKHTEYVVDVPLKKTSSLPANLSHILNEAFVFRNENFYGLIITHDDFASTFANIFTNTVSFTPLLSLIQPNYIFYDMVDLNIIVLYLSAIISALFGLFMLDVYKFIRVYFKNLQ